jgi:hypothetical protein
LVWTAQVQEITSAEIAKAMIPNPEDLTERADEWLFEILGDDFDTSLHVSSAHQADLRARLHATFVEWLDMHKIKCPSHRLVRVQEHQWKRCPAESAGDVEQCVLHAGHGKDHEYE